MEFFVSIKKCFERDYGQRNSVTWFVRSFTYRMLRTLMSASAQPKFTMHQRMKEHHARATRRRNRRGSTTPKQKRCFDLIDDNQQEQDLFWPFRRNSPYAPTRYYSKECQMAALAGAMASRTSDSSFRVSVDLSSSSTARDVMDVLGNPDLLSLWCDPVPSLVITQNSEGSRNAANPRLWQQLSSPCARIICYQQPYRRGESDVLETGWSICVRFTSSRSV